MWTWRYSKREEVRLPFLFLNNNDPVFCSLLFSGPYFGPDFLGSQTNPCFQNKNSGCKLTGRVSYIEDCLNFLTNCFGFQVLSSSFMGPYFLFYILILWIYPVKTYIGEFACYLMIYSRSVYVFTSNFYKTFYQILSSCFSGEIYKALYIYTFKIKLKKNHGKYFNHIFTQPDLTLFDFIFTYLCGRSLWSFINYGSNVALYNFLKP